MKNYDTAEELAGLEPRPFTLRGVTLHAKPQMGVREWGRLYAFETGTATGDAFEELNQIIRASLTEQSRPAWDDLLAQDLDVPISFKTLFAIAEDLATEVTGRPPALTQPSGGSPATNGTQSTAVSSPQPVGP